MPIQAQNTLAEGMLSDYRDVYANTRRTLDSRVSLLMDLNWQTNGRTNTRGYFEAAPHPRYQPQGDAIHTESMGSKSFTVTNFPYSLRIDWHKDDREDDKTGSLRQMAQTGAKGHALLPERALFDLLAATTTTIPAAPNAADGTAVFSTSTRFETSGGNSLTSTSFSSSGPQCRAAIFSALEQVMLFKDGKGQPLFNDSDLDAPILVIHAVADLDIFAEAFHQGTVAYANSTSNAGVDNALTLNQPGYMQRRFIPWPTSRLSTGTFYFACTGVPVKPFGMQQRTSIVESYADETNDPEARDTGMEYVQWRQRLGFGVGLPYGLVKVAA